MSFDEQKNNTNTNDDKENNILHSPEEINNYHSDSSHKIKIIIPLMLVAVVSFVTWSWYTDKFALSPASINDVPVVKAEKEEVRVKPSDPGGMHIANQDKMIYDPISSVQNDVDKEKIGKIVPSSEEPINTKEMVTDEAIADNKSATNTKEPAKKEEHATNQSANIVENKDKNLLAKVEQVGDSKEEVVTETSDSKSLNLAKDKESTVLKETDKTQENLADNKDAIKEEVKDQIKLVKKTDKTDSLNKDVDLDKSAKKLVIGQEEEENSQDYANTDSVNTDKNIADKSTKDKIENSNIKKKIDLSKNAEDKTEKNNKDNNQLNISNIKKEVLPIRKNRALSLPNPLASSGYKIQLGSFRSEQEVKEHWNIIKERYGDLLNSKIQYSSEKADLGNKGVFYRLQLGRFKNEEEARSVCKSFIEREQECFFVR